MKPERYREVERLYHLALECDAADRQAFLKQACGRDQTLLREVETLLAFQKPAEAFLEAPASALATSALVDGDALPPTVPALRSDAALGQIGHYRIEKKLGEGGMGRVYAARDLRLDRPVAIKMLHASTLDPDSARRLWREARAAAAINHPNICQIYEVGEANGDLFIAMELLDGESLARRIGRRPMPVAEAIQIVLEILAALSELQRHQLVHRDLKPSNILLTARGSKLVDFGLTRSAEPSAPAAPATTQTAITQPRTLIGTPHYMSPEQIQSRPTDSRADLFSAGAILFEMLTGKHAFPGATMMDVFHAVVYEQPPVLAGSPAVLAVDRIVHRALAKNPADRYQAADQMARELRMALLADDTGEPTRARPITRLIVLPFHSLRRDEETDFLAFSLPDAITATLAGLQSLVVRSSAIASRFTEQPVDLKRITGEAEVDVVLTGTLLRSDQELRVTAQLVEVPSGAIIWTKTTQTRLRKTSNSRTISCGSSSNRCRCH
jgi:serine/threonine-protein kinase